jgi:hypothetical protein
MKSTHLLYCLQQHIPPPCIKSATTLMRKHNKVLMLSAASIIVSVMYEPVWSTGGMILTRRNTIKTFPVICQSKISNELAWNQTLAIVVKSWQLNLLRGGMAYQDCCYN